MQHLHSSSLYNFKDLYFQLTGIGYSSHGEILIENHAASEFTDESLTHLVKVCDQNIFIFSVKKKKIFFFT